ncbi:hypothetical protein [Corynebacterium aquilae]|uniref:Uncharacterized protein n=1 Tax=Corynebacterium aquilae DSM 44791 TaxID=1431546 RepID=A0A1L7CIJ7_9CORY|nr:hypothetical protein [Corynebacterium aquilae]APT85680.1 hypothetical protein CAQU_12245 [Corynebacterium aquilae DSM 44791]
MPPEIRIPGLPPIQTVDILRGVFSLLPVLIIVFGMSDGPLGSSGPTDEGDDGYVVVAPVDGYDPALKSQVNKSLASATRPVLMLENSSLADDAQKQADRDAKNNRVDGTRDNTVAFAIKKADVSKSKIVDKITASDEFNDENNQKFGLGIATSKDYVFVVVKFGAIDA